MAKVLMSFRLPGDAVGLIESAIQKTAVDTTLSALLQVYVTNMGNQLRTSRTVQEKRDLLYSFLNYKF